MGLVSTMKCLLPMTLLVACISKPDSHEPKPQMFLETAATFQDAVSIAQRRRAPIFLALIDDQPDARLNEALVLSDERVRSRLCGFVVAKLNSSGNDTIELREQIGGGASGALYAMLGPNGQLIYWKAGGVMTPEELIIGLDRALDAHPPDQVERTSRR